MALSMSKAAQARPQASSSWDSSDHSKGGYDAGEGLDFLSNPFVVKKLVIFAVIVMLSVSAYFLISTHVNGGVAPATEVADTSN